MFLEVMTSFVHIAVFSSLLPEYGPQWSPEGSTNESEKAKEVVKTPWFITTAHLQR
jgi:hypothetical protein